MLLYMQKVLIDFAVLIGYNYYEDNFYEWRNNFEEIQKNNLPAFGTGQYVRVYP